MMRLLAIARNAFIETIRQPIYTVLILVTIGLLVGTVPLAHWSMGRGSGEYAETDQLNLIVWGLSTLLGTALLIAAFSAASVLSREIEEKTILTVISKPVSRPMIVLGKYLGVAAAMIVAIYICSLAYLMTVRHGVVSRAFEPFDWAVIVLGCSALAAAMLGGMACNYFFGWQYTSAAIALKLILMTAAMAVIAVVGRGWTLVPFWSGLSVDAVAAILLIMLCGLIFAAVAVAASTRLGQLQTLFVCVGFTVIGLWTNYLFEQFREVNLLARVAYKAWPNMSFFLAMDTIMQGNELPMSYAGMAAAYAACHIVAILAIGMVLFQRRETEVQASSSAPRLVTLLAWCLRFTAVAAALLAIGVAGNFDSFRRIAGAVGATAAAAGVWLLAGLVGRGAKWVYIPALAASALALVAGPAALFAPSVRSFVGQWDVGWPVAAGVADAVILLILLLPRTRYHFGFTPSKARKRGRGELRANL